MKSIWETSGKERVWNGKWMETRLQDGESYSSTHKTKDKPTYIIYTKLRYIQSRTQSYSKVSWEVCIEAMLILFCFSSQNHFPVEGRFPALTTLTTTRPKRWWRSSSNSFLTLSRIGYCATLSVEKRNLNLEPSSWSYLETKSKGWNSNCELALDHLLLLSDHQ